MISIFHSLGRLGIAGVAAGLMAVGSAAPAAASNLNFSFSFGNPGVTVYRPAPPVTYVPQCLSNQAIRSGLRNQGYRQIDYLGDNYQGWPQYQVVNAGWYYNVTVDPCSGTVYSADRIRPVVVAPPPPPPVYYYYDEPRPFGGHGDIIYHRN